MNFKCEEHNVIQKVKTLIQDLDINAPSLAVVGNRGVGKSSVLNNLIDRDILPCGINLTTKCPIVINLIQTEENEYAVILNTKKRVVLSQLREEIFKIMNEKSNGRDIISEIISLNIYLKDTLQLTLIDLPGLTKYDQNANRHSNSTSMDLIIKMTNGKNVILLAVIDANENINECETLSLCKKVDPELAWTLGVITKIDKMERGTDCMKILSNEVLPLHLRYIGLVSRSQAEINNNIGLEYFRNVERDFFKNSVYAKFLKENLKTDEDKIGSQYLKRRISEIINLKLKKTTIPMIISQVKETIEHRKNNASSIFYINDFDVDTLRKINMEDIEKSVIKQVSALKYDYYSVLNNLISGNTLDTLFTSDKTNLISFLLNTFNVLNVQFNWNELKNESDFGTSIFIKEDLIRSVIKTNMKTIYCEVSKLQNQFIDYVIKIIKNIKCGKYPSLAITFNNIILEVIKKKDEKIKYHLKTFADVFSTFLQTSDFGNKDFIAEQFNNYFDKNELRENEKYKKRNRHYYDQSYNDEPEYIEKKREVIINLAEKYLNDQKCQILNYALKLNYYFVVEFLKKDALKFLLNLNLESSEAIKSENSSIKKYIDDLINLNEAEKMLEKCLIK